MKQITQIVLEGDSPTLSNCKCYWILPNIFSGNVWISDIFKRIHDNPSPPEADCRGGEYDLEGCRNMTSFIHLILSYIVSILNQELLICNRQLKVLFSSS